MSTRLGTLTLDLICRTGNFTQGMRDASNSANRELGRIEQSTIGATNAIKGLAASAVGAFSVHQVIAYTDSYTNLQNRLKLVTNSQQELNTATKDTFDIAQATAQSWGSVAQVYQRFAENSGRLGITMQQTASLTDTVSKAISISGASASSAEAALMQFGQALASGVLRGEEFNSIAEQAPALLKAIATGLGVNIGELRKMAGEGQLTGDVVIEALEKAKISVDDLFSKTDFTIAQSFTQLNDSVTKFVGEAGQGSGAAKALASSIKLVADNIDSIASVATLGGVAFLTKAVIGQTIAMRESVVASAQRRLADTAALESQVRLSALEVQRMRQVTALAMTELNLARQEFNSASTRSARAAATIRLTQAEVAHNIALNQSTVALAANNVAQNSLNASRAFGARALALIGGPIGALTIGVTALAAGYMYMEDKAAKANKKLSEQADVANKAKDELLALEGAQKKGAIVDLSAAFESQNKSLYALTFQFNTYMRMIEGSNRGNLEVVRISELVHSGKMTEIEALRRLNTMNVITPNQFKQGEKYVNTLEEMRGKTQNTGNALKVFGINVELAGNNAANSALKISSNTNELNKNALAATGAAKAQIDFFASLNKEVASSNEKLAYLNLGYNKDVIDRIQSLQQAKQKAAPQGVTTFVTYEEIEKLSKAQSALDALKEKEDSITQAKKDQNKELQKQNELQKMVGASALSGLRIKSSESVAGGKVRGYTAEFAQLTQDALGDRLGRFTAFNDTYHKGTNSKHAIGNAFDFTTKNAKDAELAIMKLNALAKQYGFTIKTINEYSNPSSRATGGHVHVSVLGYKGGEDALKDAKAKLKMDQDYTADRKKEAQEINQLLQQYSNADVVRNQKRIAEITEAERLGQQQLIPKINERFANENRLAELQYDQQLNAWNWKEDEKLKKEAEINKATISLSNDFNSIQKQFAKEAIDDQLAYELQVFRKTQLQKQFEQLNSLKSMQSQIRGLSGNADDIFAKATMSPQAYGRWSLENDRDDSQLDLLDQLKSTEQNIAVSSAYTNDDERYQALLDAHKEYRDGLYAIDIQYDEQVKELAQNQHNAQMDIWQDLLSRTSTIFSSMAEMVKNTAGESSAAYKAMFLVNQGISIAQALINTEVAATKAMAEGGMVAGIPMSTAIRALGYASVGLIAGQTIAGMAHDGIDNIPKEGTWLLDKGERVVDSRTNSDLKNYLADGAGSKAPNVNVYTLPGETADVSMNSDGSLDVRIRKIAGEYLDGQLSNPNSQTSKTMKQNFNVAQRR